MGMNSKTPYYRKNSRKLRQLESDMEQAKTYEQWKASAIKHDSLSGAEKWKNTLRTRLYDFNSIRTRTDNLQKHRADRNDFGILFSLNEGVHGNMAGMGKPILYTKAKFGTKKLIEDYIQEISDSLHHLASDEHKQVPLDKRFEFFRRASHSYGRSALMLSGGGALGNFHLGVVKVLLEQHLLPIVISGSSAGAFIAGVVGTHTDQELLQMFEDGSFPKMLSEGADEFKFELNSGGLVDVNLVDEGIARLVPDLTFEQAYKKTGRNINISISALEKHQTSRLLNAITSPNVLIRSAIRASSAVPGVFPPVALKAVDEKGVHQDYLPSRRWVDGSFSQDLPAKRLARLFGVNHFIVSQVNPAVLPLLTDPKIRTGISGSMSEATLLISKQSLRSLVSFVHNHIPLGAKINMLLNNVHALMDQEYTGDINIFPSFRFIHPNKIIAAASEDEVKFLIGDGERATWPKVEAIRNNTLIGKTLDEILIEFEKNELHWLRTGPKVFSKESV